MAGKLTAAAVRAAKAPGRYTDGQGLHLFVGADGSRRWVLRVQRNGKRMDIGLGPVADVPLAEARAAAADMRRAFREGRNPVAERREARERPTIPSFEEAARACHAEHAASWKNAKHRAQFISTLEQYVFPHFGDAKVCDVSGPAIRDALAEIWLVIPETARRVRQRIGTVLDYSHAKGWRPEPFNMKSVSAGLPRQPKKDAHFEALDWREVPEFLERLRASDATGPVKAAFEYLTLTACRSGEVRGARWSEIDLDRRLWCVPAERMKAGRAHTVPLSDRAVEILQTARGWRLSDDPAALVFPGARRGKPLSDMTLTMLLRRLDINATAHGFRSSFRDWAAEATNMPREIAELCLAHTVGSAVERAYARSDLLEKRRALMDLWGRYCCGERGNVVPLSRPAAG